MLSLSLGLGARSVVGFQPPPALKLAGTGLRLPTSSATKSGFNYVAADMAMGMPDVEVEEVAFFFPAFFCNTGDEVDCPNGYTIEGIATRASDGTREVGTIDGGTAPIVIDPSEPATQYGKWITFRPATPIPAGVVQIFTIAYFVPDGLYPNSRGNVVGTGLSNIFGEIMPDERFQGFATSAVPSLSTSTSWNNSNGPRPTYPSMAMMRAVPRSALIIGDSIQYGSQQSRSWRYYTARMTFSQVEMAMDDNVGSARISANNMAIPGWGMGNILTTGSQANATASQRQLWALEKARELNGGRPIADMIWCGHFQNSSGADLSVLLDSARDLAAIWRTAIGDGDAPLYWVGAAANATSTDSYQTLVNQTPATANQAWPDGARWTFNEAHESPTGALRTDGTVQGGVPIWQVSSQNSTDDRDIFSVRPFTATLTSAYSGTGTMQMDAAPTPGAWINFIDGTTVIPGSVVDAVTGTGPFTVTIAIPGSPAIPSGATVKEIWTDNGVHPSPIAHTLYRDAIIAGKVALGFTAPPVPDVAPVVSGVSISGIAQDGQTLTAEYTVTGSPAPSVAVTWKDGAAATIGTGNTLLLNAGSMGLVDAETITLDVSATNTAGSDGETATTTFTVPAPAILVQGATAGYFVDPANVPSGTTRITFRGDFKFPALSSGPILFAQESTGCDISLLSNGQLRATVEDGAGAKMLNAVGITGGGAIIAGTMQTIEVDVNQVTEEVTVTIDGGTPIVTPFTISGTGQFQTGREVSFLASSAGASAVPQNTEFQNLEVDFNGTLHKAIPNNAATANADAWHRGGDFTEL